MAFLLRQRTQLTSLQNQLHEGQKAPEKTENEELKPPDHQNQDIFSENLAIIKELQLKLDGMAVELRIRGEMIVERDNALEHMHKKLHDLETQISIFKDQIAPALEQTITELRTQKEALLETIEKQDEAIRVKDDRILASQKILEHAGLGNLITLEELQVQLDKKDKQIIEQEEAIKTLQQQVDQLPTICLQMNNQIKKRDSQINELKIYNSVLNKKLHFLQQDLNKNTAESGTIVTDLTNQMIHLQEELQAHQQKTSILDKEILLLNGLLMEKEAKIVKLEEKIQNFLF
ncbi:MAG: hypothetical protein EU536_00365 [Promethearchaeota archaeon]|nr:MAG: hypothetical protein EU536_00365 [Candidatus Lokiarchaeota archaeon]